MFDGRLDNRRALSRSLQDHPVVSPDVRDADLVAAAYDRFGETFVEHVEGDFALCVFDQRKNRLLLARDRLGLRPLCYAVCNETFLFASDAKALLDYAGIKAVPDEAMLADFLLYFLSHDAQNRTFFQGIHSLSPAHLLIATPERLNLHRYFEFDTERRLRFSAFGDYVSAFNQFFAASVRKRLRSPRPVAVSVSGGLDSAYIFCVAQRLVREEPGLCPTLLGFNYGGPPGTPSDEIGFVHHIEQECGAKIEHIAQQRGFMDCAGEEVWHSESPSVEALACLEQGARRRMHAAGAGRLLTGHWGDQLLSDSDYLLDLLRSGRWRLLQRHAKRWGVSAPRLAIRFARDLAARRLPSSVTAAMRRARGWRNATSRSAWFTPRFRRLLLERFAAKRLTRRAGTSHAWAVYQQSRLGYHVRCMEWNIRIGAMHGLDVAFPYLDCDLIQFLMSIPGDVQSHEGASRGLMRAAMRGTVPDAVIGRRSKGEFTYLGNQNIEHDFDAIREMLGPTALSIRLGYVDGPVLWQMLEGWRTAIRTADDAVLTDRIVDLCGMELLLRRFFSNS
jgi:asparagine synthase (glutamine-hydrolysing)